jgi:hypothetical protein
VKLLVYVYPAKTCCVRQIHHPPVRSQLHIHTTREQKPNTNRPTSCPPPYPHTTCTQHYVYPPPLHIHLLASPHRIPHQTLPFLPLAENPQYVSELAIHVPLYLPHPPCGKQQSLPSSLPAVVGEEDLSGRMCGMFDSGEKLAAEIE